MFKHCSEQKLTYPQHLMQAVRYSMRLLSLSIVSMVHALVPCCFETFVSKEVMKLSKTMGAKCPIVVDEEQQACDCYNISHCKDCCPYCIK